jgi:hypothetical protein
MNMPRELLSIQDIKELNKLLRQVFEYITNLKRRERLADKIKYPQLPSILTESLAIHLLKEKSIIPELAGFSFNFGGRTADILATKNSQTIKIEVKATAKSAFEYFGEKDISADYILWLHFAEFYMNLKDTNIEVYIIKKPGDYFNSPIKITLSKLKQVIGSNLIKMDFNINSL